MRQYLIFNNADSRNYEVYISGPGVFDSAEREYSAISVPGRTGDLIMDGKRYKNRELKYPGFIYRDFQANIARWRNFLASCVGYQTLTDSYDPDHFYRALFKGPLKVNPTKKLDAGEFDMEFTIDPRRWLISGQTTTTLTATGSITNPTLFEARPLLRVYGTGTVKIGNDTITISTNSTYTDIDCDLREAFRGSTNLNGNISLSGLDFPAFGAGANNITLSSGITRVIITPRWWEL